ncbi:MAG TPA: hypothetical protein VMF06_21220 [Candidatus Limnocylindria bacterium]|jgi:hypothetical protein|nr:hypothetical protein [Candidatus Limnocylindria bacterium]
MPLESQTPDSAKVHSTGLGPSPDILTRLATVPGGSVDSAKARLFRLCAGQKFLVASFFLKPFCGEAIAYARATVDDLGRCRTRNEVLDVLSYWEERRPLDFRSWPARLLVLDFERVMTILKQYVS